MDTYPRVAVTATETIVRRETLIEALHAAYFQDRAAALEKRPVAEKSKADDAL